MKYFPPNIDIKFEFHPEPDHLVTAHLTYCHGNRTFGKTWQLTDFPKKQILISKNIIVEKGRQLVALSHFVQHT